jgi:alpha/beta superfamily hydrolase
MRNQKVTFDGAHGTPLSARLSLPPDGEVVACALFAHCFTCSKDLKPVVNISRALTQQRIAVLRFDFTGLGESEGDFADTTFTSNIEDLVAAAEYMGREIDAPAILVGHSLGGAAVLQAASRIESVRAVATIGAPFDPAHVTHLSEGSLEEIEDGHRMEQAIAGLGRPLLIFHSPVDQTVGIDNAALIYKAA